MSVWGRTDDERVERSLRGLLAAGLSLEEAVRSLHVDDHVGALFIGPAVALVANLTEREAKRLVVRSLSAL